MILRKPYAFFIKHFKFFHLVLSVLTIYSLIRVINIISYINQYLSTATAVDNLIPTEDVATLYSYTDNKVHIAMAIISALLLFIMTMKKKKNKFYIFSTILPILLIFLNKKGCATMYKLTAIWVSSTELNTLVDLYLFVAIGLLIQAAVTISRTVGFNISRFDFNSDILKLQIDEKDREEVGFVADFDFNDLKRDWRKNFRYVKYFIKAYKKTMIICFILFGIFAFGFYGYTNMKTQIKPLSRLEFRNKNISDYEIDYNNSYIINTDSAGNKIGEGRTFVVVDLSITNYGYEDSSFPYAVLGVGTGEDTYTPTIKYKNEVNDLGNVYDGKIVKMEETVDNIYMFEVPERDLNKTLYLSAIDLYSDRVYYLEINPVDLRVYDNEYIDVNKGDEVTFDGDIFRDSKLVINKIETSDYFQLPYEFYATKNRHYTSYEYMRADVARANQDRCVMRIEGYFDTPNTNITNLYQLLAHYGYIEYRIGDDIYQQNNGFVLLSPKKVKEKNVIYVEVLENIRQADTISIVFNVRGTSYSYLFDNADVKRQGENK
jgi:hypothetical protein